MNKILQNKSRKMFPGFTLIELMVVLVILGLLATFIGPKVMSAPDKARVTKAINDIKALESALNMYKLENGNYPTTDQGLHALVEKPEIDPIPNNYSPGGYLSTSTVPKDPWGNDYIYRSPTEDENRDYEIITYGADGREGGENFDADIATFTIDK